MTVSSCDKPVLYCDCTTREPNIDSTSVDPTCNSCQERLPDDKAIYMVLKNHVRDLRYLVGRGSKNKKYQRRMKSRGNRNVMDDIESDPYPEDVQKLHDKYGFEVVRSSATVLVNSSPLTMRSIYSFYDWHGLATRSVEVDSDLPREVTWAPEPTPGPERAPSPCDCTPEVDVGPEDDRPTESDGYAEPEAIIEEKYVDIRDDDVQEKPCDADLSPPHDGDGYTKDKAQEGATKPGDSTGDGDIHHGQESPDRADIYAPCRNRYQDKNGTVSVQLGIQYELMVQLQRYIERACYAFGSGEIPETLTQNGWDCDEAVTLDRWMREFLDRPEIFDVGGSVESPQSLFQRLREIQAVNLSRKRLTSDEIHEFLSDACALMDVLNVSGYKEILKKLELRIGKLLVDFAVRYESFRQRRDEKLKQVKSERARLDMLERTILAEMEDDMEGNQSMVKREIRIALDKTAAKFETDIEWEEDRGE
ncbi:hypothetical protein FOMG_19063 [Fusarium oxysporum f. sp. melonis 26406]|uniref:Uncharacterized protein n=2 Tax=Fusarium oxysporum TaxID=5507 RepID=A0A2H3G7T3_FUSOX|nr:hypothetical protein FOMG_19063 [Fusarium oxysporum f. sp. melonis 26406]PCD21743.1 hypothetical protein AU210_015546 [Fusarium oxysporum f. sp. radicis-cucumerinum]